tara:strand:- start:412 stop:744 length:333 start_codon:yes stop_codon:yes gene_type:complete
MTRPAWPKEYPEIVFNKTKGKCFHCKKKIVLSQRRPKDGKFYWEIDHYPVQYCDIKNQCCIGITDPLDLDNLVPSCGYCNKSHNFENKNIYCCCIKSSQFPCKKINCTIL